MSWHRWGGCKEPVDWQAHKQALLWQINPPHTHTVNMEDTDRTISLRSPRSLLPASSVKIKSRCFREHGGKNLHCVPHTHLLLLCCSCKDVTSVALWRIFSRTWFIRLLNQDERLHLRNLAEKLQQTWWVFRWSYPCFFLFLVENNEPNSCGMLCKACNAGFPWNIRFGLCGEMINIAVNGSGE